MTNTPRSPFDGEVERGAVTGNLYPSQVESATALKFTTSIPIQHHILDWEVLPSNHVEVTDRPPIGRTARHSIRLNRAYAERIHLLHAFRPRACYLGTDLGRRVYHVSVFDSVVIADCESDGNALYFCSSKGWQRILGTSKAEALKHGAGRIVHRGEWRDRVRGLIGRGHFVPTQYS